MYNFEEDKTVQSTEDEKERIELEKLNALDDIRVIIKTPQGQRFFKRFFKLGNLLEISMNGNSWTFFNEGHRNFAKMIYTEVCEADENFAAKLVVELTKETKGAKK